MMKKLILILSALFLSAAAFAQSSAVITIKDVTPKGTNIAVSYDVKMANSIWFDVSIYLSVDGGKTYYKTPLKAVSGDVGRITSGGLKTIIWDAKAERSLITSKNLKFKISIDNYKEKKVYESKVLIGAVAAVNLSGISHFSADQLSYGLMAGWVKKFGFYVKASSNFDFTKTSITCDENGKIAGKDAYIWTSGKSKVSFLSISAGGIFTFSDMFRLYVGAGYGNRNLAWQAMDGSWAKVGSVSGAGAAADLGLIMKFGMFSVSAGANALIGKSIVIQPQIGLGVMF